MKVFGGEIDETWADIYAKFVCSDLLENLDDIFEDCELVSLTFNGKNRINAIIKIRFKENWLHEKIKGSEIEKYGVPENKIGLLSVLENYKMIKILKDNFNLIFGYRPQFYYVTIP